MPATASRSATGESSCSGCYLFGLSPMPFWVFALVSTLGRMPGTWVLSAQGAETATGDYLTLALLTALVAAVAVPLYYYRHRIVARVRSRTAWEKPARDPGERRMAGEVWVAQSR